MMDVKIEEGWKSVLKTEFTKPYFQNAVTFIKTEKSQGKTIFPPDHLSLTLSIKHRSIK